jgi:predicted metal-dependent hydrolase
MWQQFFFLPFFATLANSEVNVANDNRRDILRERISNQIKLDREIEDLKKITAVSRDCLPQEEIEENLKKALKSIKKSCGQICDQTLPGTPGKYFDYIEKKVDCQVKKASKMASKTDGRTVF